MKTHNKLISVVLGCFLSLCGVVNCFAQIHVEKTLWRKLDFTIVPKYKIVGTDSVQSILLYLVEKVRVGTPCFGKLFRIMH